MGTLIKHTNRQDNGYAYNYCQYHFKIHYSKIALKIRQKLLQSTFAKTDGPTIDWGVNGSQHKKKGKQPKAQPSKGAV